MLGGAVDTDGSVREIFGLKGGSKILKHKKTVWDQRMTYKEKRTRVVAVETMERLGKI